MPTPNKTKSRTYRRVKRTTPGGNNVTHYERRTPNQAKCGSCGGLLHGIPRGTSAEMRKLAKTEKRPERPYGGVLCSKCMRTLLKKEA